MDSEKPVQEVSSVDNNLGQSKPPFLIKNLVSIKSVIVVLLVLGLLGLGIVVYTSQQQVNLPSRVSNEKAISIPNALGFSNLSANLTDTQAQFNFNVKTRLSVAFDVFISNQPNFSYLDKLQLSFGTATSSPIIVNNPTLVNSSYVCGRTIYWRVVSSDRTSASPVSSTRVNCIAPTPTLPSSITPTIILPTPTPTPTPTAKRVFVTRTSYNGNLGGLSGADAKCQARADAVNLGGTWKAWLSDSVTNAKSRLTQNSGPYRSLGENELSVADNWNDLTDGNIIRPINFTEINVGSSDHVWTNTSASGSKITDNVLETCQDWTSAVVSDSGWAGIAIDKNLWTVAIKFACSKENSLYCFEQ